MAVENEVMCVDMNVNIPSDRERAHALAITRSVVAGSVR